MKFISRKNEMENILSKIHSHKSISRLEFLIFCGNAFFCLRVSFLVCYGSYLEDSFIRQVFPQNAAP